jgi:hypothetical protein
MAIAADGVYRSMSAHGESGATSQAQPLVDTPKLA